MTAWKSAEDILTFAIGEEEAAAHFYKEWAAKMDNPALRDALNGFAREEEGHKERLLNIKAEGSLQPDAKTVQNLNIGDNLVTQAPNPDMAYPEILIIAMKKEKAAFKLYSELAAVADSASLKDTFLALAQEEAKHKLRFEIEYDDYMTDN